MKRRLLFWVLLLPVLSVQAQFAPQNHLSIIQDHLQQHAVDFHLKVSDVEQLELTDQHSTDDVTYTYIRQQYLQKPIFDGVASIAIKQGEVVHVASRLHANIGARIVSEPSTKTALEAFEELVKGTGYSSDFNRDNIRITPGVTAYSFLLTDSNLARVPVRMSMGYRNQDNQLVPVWQIVWGTSDGHHLYMAYVYSHKRGIQGVRDLTISCSFDAPSGSHGHNMVGAAAPEMMSEQRTQATESYRVFAFPIESPNHGNRSVVTAPADVTYSPLGWHDVNGIAGAEFNITRGNNVFARDDIDGNDAGGTSPNGGTDLVFDASYSKSVSAENQLEAATINLFYANNVMHDVWAHYGFDEASGNFQQKNYSGNGQGNDYVIAEAQDGYNRASAPSFNNANFQPYPEGDNGIMQMFLWSAGGGGEIMNVLNPSDVAGPYGITQAGFGNKRLSKQKVTGKLVLVDDGSSSPTLACQTIQNGAEVSGNIAVIDRGSCNFDDKILRAQTAGAIAVVMINNVGGGTIVMGGDAATVNIPSVMLSKADGDLLRQRMQTSTVTVELYDSSNGQTFFYDSDFDNGIIAHEYTHGISTRLTGGASNSDCLGVTEQMGEGWSDFLTLVMTHEPGDMGSDKRGIGTYVRNEATDGGGIRPYPYSTSFSINPVTYNYIKQNQFTVPHGVGSVWCSMLWDLYWAFIDEYGYDPDLYEGTGGNNMVMHLVMDGLKLQPCGPGFVDGRDAILKADELRYGGKNKLLIWSAFAKRGLGYSADQGLVTSKFDGTEAFDLPPSFGQYSVSKTGPKEAHAGDTVQFEIKVKNTGDEPFNKIVMQDSLLGAGVFLESDGRCLITFDESTFTFEFDNLTQRDSVVCGYTVILDTAAGGKLLYFDGFEEDTSTWTNENITGIGGWIRTTTRSAEGSYSYFVSNPTTQSDRVLKRRFDLTKVAKPHLVFDHWYNTENEWDGAVVEIFDRGLWRDLGSRMIANGYNVRIQANPESNISNQMAFSGNSEAFVRTVIDLTDYAGNDVEIRFRMVSDGAAGGEGWYVDDVSLWNGYSILENRFSAKADALKALSTSTFTTIINDAVPDTVPVIIIDVTEQFVVYPVPFGSSFNIRFESKVDRDLDLELIDQTGRLIWTGSISPVSTMLVPTDHLADGMYFLQVNDRGEIRRIKVMKKSR